MALVLVGLAGCEHVANYIKMERKAEAEEVTVVNPF